jgi:hypothetical protein
MKSHLLAALFAVFMTMAAPAMAQNITVLPGGCGTANEAGQFGQPISYLTVDNAGNLCELPGTITPVIAGSAANGVVVKPSAGNLYSAYATCTAACWLMAFNSTTIPADGATTAGTASGNLQDCVPIAAGGSGTIGSAGGPPETFTVGISLAISSTACATKTAAATGFVKGSAR